MKSPFKNLSERIAAFDTVDLYPVITSEFCGGRDPLYVLRQVAEGGATLVQLREKHLCARDCFNLACRFREITSEFGMLLIIDDSVDIALAVDADGVHLGQEDLPLTAAKRIAPELLIGISTHNREEGVAAMKDGAGYVNVGPIFATGTKAVPYKTVGLDVLAELAPTMPIPFSIMGGIKASHIPGLVRMGVKRIAMITEITQAEDVRARTEMLRNLIKENL